MNFADRDVEPVLERYRDLVFPILIRDTPREGPRWLYELLTEYPRRGGKGLRSALCLAACEVFGGEVASAVNTAVAIELFHNAFLIQDDIQDGSEYRRGAGTLHTIYGVGVALNVGAATNLLGLQRIRANRELLGSQRAWEVFAETESMLKQSLEGQALELEWIRENVCDLTASDYLQMCLKKTTWYTCIYPCRTGALIAGMPPHLYRSLDRFAWYLGAAFQIQDDLLNLDGDYNTYGKEILGDLWEGKRTLMLIHLLAVLRGPTAVRLHDFLGQSRENRTSADVQWVFESMQEKGSFAYARMLASELAKAGRLEAEALLREVPDSAERRFLLGLPQYVIQRNK